jgi:hypothetical protein
MVTKGASRVPQGFAKDGNLTLLVRICAFDEPKRDTDCSKGEITVLPPSVTRALIETV